ncbi:hypothetical protein GCM10009544_52310 [Streptomyces stramineus]|uniref:FtsK domain-containing protein n=1 Tax=Streptomyces stramineus TaxID=173861 RepID=A0ABN1AUI6_9ACTN
MGRRPLPSTLTDSTPIARGRELARCAADNAADVFHPLIVIARGLRALAAAGGRRWARLPKDRRGPTLLLVASCAAIVALVPYGPALAVISLMVAGAWAGRERAPRAAAPDGEAQERLQVLYESLVPYLSVPEDPDPLYAHGGGWEKAFTGHSFDDNGRLVSLRLRYPAYFTDGEAASRARIEQLLKVKAGRGREYRFDWDEEANRLTLSALPPLPTDICAQRFVTAPGETVLGFTDPSAVQRTLPVMDADGTRDEPPVVWRTGPRSTEPHLLALGLPAGGTTTLLRSVVLQALHHGDALIIDGSGTGEYACLRGREGVLAVESSPAGALAILEWASHETERRLVTANYARQQGRPAPEDIRRPLWIVIDRPTALSHLAAGEGRPDPQGLLDVPLRHGRGANVTVAVGEHFENAGLLDGTLLAHTRARVILGPVAPEQVRAALGAPPHTTPTTDVPPGRGYARLGSGPVHRLQVPATPDPYDEDTTDAQRQAVLRLLPEPDAPVPYVPEHHHGALEVHADEIYTVEVPTDDLPTGALPPEDFAFGCPADEAAQGPRTAAYPPGGSPLQDETGAAPYPPGESPQPNETGAAPYPPAEDFAPAAAASAGPPAPGDDLRDGDRATAHAGVISDECSALCPPDDVDPTGNARDWTAPPDHVPAHTGGEPAHDGPPDGEHVTTPASGDHPTDDPPAWPPPPEGPPAHLYAEPPHDGHPDREHVTAPTGGAPVSGHHPTGNPPAWPPAPENLPVYGGDEPPYDDRPDRDRAAAHTSGVPDEPPAPRPAGDQAPTGSPPGRTAPPEHVPAPTDHEPPPPEAPPAHPCAETPHAHPASDGHSPAVRPATGPLGWPPPSAVIPVDAVPPEEFLGTDVSPEDPAVAEGAPGDTAVRVQAT